MKEFLGSDIDSLRLMPNGETRFERLVCAVTSSEAEFFQTRQDIVFLINGYCSLDTVVLNSTAKINRKIIV